MGKQSGGTTPDARIHAPSRGGMAQFEGWGLRVPLPRWALYGVGALVVAASAFTLYVRLVVPFLDQRKALATLEYVEYQKHFFETPRGEQTLVDNDDLGKLSVAFYSSDRCLLVKRTVPGAAGATVDRWIRAEAIEREPSPGDVGARQRASLSAAPALLAAAGVRAQPAHACSMGRCLNPHAGEFQSWNGETRGCWVQVWRRWPDGCQHYQWFNACNGYWDGDANGPRVFWTCCHH